MHPTIFYRGLLFALCEREAKRFPADGERFHEAFMATLEYACERAPGQTPAEDMLDNFDPVFGVSPEATEMILEGERDFILALFNPSLEIASFKLEPDEAKKELEELPSPEVFRDLAKRFHERLQQ